MKKARSSDFLGSVMDKVRSTWVDVTAGVQSQMIYELIIKNNAFHEQDLVLGKMVTVNLGSREDPSHVKFIGLASRWFLAPWIVIDWDNVSILQEGEGGGR